MKYFFFLFVTYFTASSAHCELANPISCIGASITRGYGAGQSLCTKINRHINENIVERIENSRMLILLDAFFPTKYFNLTKPEIDHYLEVTQLFKQYDNQYDLILVLPLAAIEQFKTNNRQYILSSKGSNFNNILRALDRYSYARSRVNDAIRSTSITSSKFDLLSFEPMVDHFRTNDLFTTDFFKDSIHVNSAGQKKLINTILLPKIREHFDFTIADID